MEEVSGGPDVVLAFGDHQLDIGRRELRRGAAPIELEPKAVDLLVFLVENRDRVVSEDDLPRAVWGGRFVSESALTTRVNAVRRALGDDAIAYAFLMRPVDVVAARPTARPPPVCLQKSKQLWPRHPTRIKQASPSIIHGRFVPVHACPFTVSPGRQGE